ncbi:hypothetical protein FRC07_012658, partial [Ceratobasidium sp. 392]
MARVSHPLAQSQALAPPSYPREVLPLVPVRGSPDDTPAPNLANHELAHEPVIPEAAGNVNPAPNGGEQLPHQVTLQGSLLGLQQ